MFIILINCDNTMQVNVTSQLGFVHFCPFMRKTPPTFIMQPQSMDNTDLGCCYPKDAFWKLPETFPQWEGQKE